MAAAFRRLWFDRVVLSGLPSPNAMKVIAYNSIFPAAASMIMRASSTFT